MPRNRKLGRPTAHRNAMLRGMVTLLLENGQIKTTLTRAKEVRSMAEKMITLAKEKLGWEPKVKLDEGLDHIIDYFRKKLAL